MKYTEARNILIFWLDLSNLYERIPVWGFSPSCWICDVRPSCTFYVRECASLCAHYNSAVHSVECSVHCTLHCTLKNSVHCSAEWRVHILWLQILPTKTKCLSSDISKKLSFQRKWNLLNSQQNRLKEDQNMVPCIMKDSFYVYMKVINSLISWYDFFQV